jgi:Lon protease-like protein
MEIPIFPLGSVLFPGGRLPLRIFEPRYVEMIRACIGGNSVFGVALIRAGYEVGKPAVPYDVGCIARIQQWQESGPDRYELIARGESVFRILRRRVTATGLIMAEVELADPPDPAPVPARHEALKELLTGLIEQIGAEQFPSPQRLDDAAWVANRLCELLPVTPERKQMLLELRRPGAMLDAVEGILKQLREEGEDG